MAPSIVWFRHDLRVTDNPALTAAVERKEPVVPLWIWSPEEEGEWPPGAASRVWLHGSLESLGARLESLGSKLVIRSGSSARELSAVARECGADAVFWNRRYEPGAIARDNKLEEDLRVDFARCESFNGSLLADPWETRKRDGTPYLVFTQFWKNLRRTVEPEKPLPAPRTLAAPAVPPASRDLRELALVPGLEWPGRVMTHWEPGEDAAGRALALFAGKALREYDSGRNLPGRPGTSRLSPHLHFGELSPRSVWHAVLGGSGGGSGAESFLKELGWREFAAHLLFHHPETPLQPLRGEFRAFPWRKRPAALAAWQRGRTGFPIVDAGMRELWATGWMHNRVRMIAASFLVKDLLIRWQEGARWFWDTLVDADLANNTLGWQWTAGCGADAAPYFRVFNPVLQGERFDPGGDYVRRWVPELRSLPSRWIHRPFEAPSDVLESANIRLGSSYPKPIVDHAEAREAALAAYDDLRETVRSRAERL